MLKRTLTLVPHQVALNARTCHQVKTKIKQTKTTMSYSLRATTSICTEFLRTIHSTLPEIALKIIRLHSCYLWHKGGDYMHLCDESDLEVLPCNKEFSKFDLYTKSEEIPDIDALLPYYQGLIVKYIPGSFKW